MGARISIKTKTIKIPGDPQFCPPRPSRRLRRALLPLAAALAFTSAARGAAAHLGAHDGPVWCGPELAALTDSGVLLDDGIKTRLVAMPKSDLLAWSPDCSRLAVVGDRVRLVTKATGAVDDLGGVPAGFTRATKMDWLQPSIVWSPSGATFGVSFGDRVRGRNGVVLFNPATGVASEAKLPRGEIDGFSLLDDATVVASIRVGRISGPFSLYRATSSSASQIGSAGFERIALSPPAAKVVAMRSGGDIVYIDTSTGAESPLFSGASFLVGISERGGFAFISKPAAGAKATALAAIPLAVGPPKIFRTDADHGISGSEHHGWDPAGAFLVSHIGAKVFLDTGAAAPRLLYDAGPVGPQLQGKAREVSHVRVSPDGKRAAFIAEIGEGTLSAGRCTWEWQARVDLITVALSGPPSPKVRATLAKLKRCAVD